MKKTLIASLLAAGFAAPALAEDSPHSFTANVGVVSDYLFRGISQTHGKPAIQGGVDYAHSSGFYAGAWGSTIKWVEDAQDRNVPVEIDLYGGYKNTFGGGDWNYDVGMIAYMYPGSKSRKANWSAKADTQEVYAALGWKFLTLKYSRAISSHFIGWYGDDPSVGDFGKTRGSGYLELNANYDMGDGWTLIGHIGHQKVKNFNTSGLKSADYTDWKVGVSKDIGFGVMGLAYSGTNTKGSCNSGGGTNPYCWAEYHDSTGTYGSFRDMSKGRLILSFSKTF